MTEEEKIQRKTVDILEAAGAIVICMNSGKVAHMREIPSLFSLREACEFAGKSYSTVKRKNHLQPLCGYYDHWEDTPQRRNPRWTRQQVMRWAEVTKPQRIDYAEELLYGEDTHISAGALHMLIKDAEDGRLPEYLQAVIDKYCDEVAGTARLGVAWQGRHGKNTE